MYSRRKGGCDGLADLPETLSTVTTMSYILPLRLKAALLLAMTAAAVRADDDRLRTATPSPLYRQECGSCHMAFPPGLLPAVSWQRIMQGLDKHYGVDASLEAADIRAISQWLQGNSGTYKRVAEAPPEDRITRSAWFARKHREVRDSVWRRPAVGGRANCQACHGGADQGDFDDDRIHIPR